MTAYDPGSIRQTSPTIFVRDRIEARHLTVVLAMCLAILVGSSIVAADGTVPGWDD